ncbi:MAG: sulfur carrier protein ThiS, partial [Candidatus Rokuibacteriota bacterium]
MTVTVNGKPMELPEGLSIEELLARLKVRREFPAVALHRAAPQRARNPATQLPDGDKLENDHPKGGGSTIARRAEAG